MPHCGGANSCNCVVTGDGVSGSGTLSDPYVITSVPEGGGGEPSAAALLDLPTAGALLRMAQLRAGQDLLITAVGDSETAGTSLGGGGYDTSWPARLATLLGPVVGRWYEYGQRTATDSLKWTLTNTSGTSGPGAEGILQIRPGDYVTITTPVATTLKVRYANSGFVGALAGNLQVTIDGTVVTTITPNGTSSQATWTSGTLSNATHTMVLRNTHATAVAWCVAVYAGTAGTGITLNNAGLSGSTTDTWQATHHLSVWAHAARETSAVGIAFLSLGVNDAGLGVPVATYKTRLTALAQRMKGIWAATIIVIQPQPSGVPWATWLTYTEAAREVADEQGCGIVDITQRWGPHDGTWGSTRLYSDVTHPSALGYRDIATAIYHHLDAIASGAAMVAGSGIQITVNDAGDTITISSTAVLPTRQVIAGTGLDGGGDLSANRTLSVAYGTTAGTAAQGNDSRLSDARTPTAHTHTASQVSDSTATGRALLTAVDAADARTAIGAGTSNLVVGTGAGDAKAGNYQPTAANVSDSTATGRALLTAADAAAARTTLGLDTAATVGALPIPDPGSFYPTDTITAALQLIGDRERYGTGSPEGVVTAAVGTYYTDTAGTNGAWRWQKRTGAGNTGWVVTTGDGGWRDITSLLVNAWSGAAGSVLALRTTDTVTIAFENLSGAAATATTAFTLPVGYRPRTGRSSRLLFHTATPAIKRFLAYDSGIVTYNGTVPDASGSNYGLQSYPAASTWPASHPGVAA